MDVVGCNQLDIMFTCQFDQHFVYFLLFGIGGAVGVRVVCLVPLYFQVIIFAKQVFEPLDRLFRLIYPVVHDVLRDLSPQTGRADDQVFMILFDQFMVDTRTSVETFRPRDGYHLDQVLVAVHILSQHDQVVTASVFLRRFIMPSVACTITFAADNRLEYLFLFRFYQSR